MVERQGFPLAKTRKGRRKLKTKTSNRTKGDVGYLKVNPKKINSNESGRLLISLALKSGFRFCFCFFLYIYIINGFLLACFINFIKLLFYLVLLLWLLLIFIIQNTLKCYYNFSLLSLLLLNVIFIIKHTWNNIINIIFKCSNIKWSLLLENLTT